MECSMNRSVFCVALVGAALAFCATASAQEVVLKSADRGVEVRLVPTSGGSATHPNFLVSWDHLAASAAPGAATGTLVFYRESGAHDRTYVSVGKAAPFVLVDRGDNTLVAGTVVPTYDLVLAGSDTPIEMRVDVGKHPKADELQAAYEQGQGLSHTPASKGEVETVVDAARAAFQAACGAKPKLEIKWADFSGDRARLASTLAAVVNGIADKCSDAKYKTAIAKLSTFRVHFDISVAADKLDLRRASNTVDLAVGQDVVNPRQRATAWITADL
jgi:hypothetical protein